MPWIRLNRSLRLFTLDVPMSQKFLPYALFLLLFLPTAKLAAQSDDGRGTFQKAYSLHNQGNTSQAKELFQKTLENGYRLADYSLYYLALIAFKESNWEQSRRYLLQLNQSYPQSVWQARATLQRAKLDQAEKKFAQANEILRQLRTDKSVSREIADEASYLIAQNQETHGRFATRLLQLPGITRQQPNFALGRLSAQGSVSLA